MEESQTLFEELCKLKEGLGTIEREEWEAVTDPETEDRMITLLVAERVLTTSDKRIRHLQKHFESKASEIRARRAAYHHELGEISKKLGELTRPAIHSYLEELEDLRRRSKLSREILSKEFHGFSQRTVLSILSNEKAISRIYQLVREGTKKLQSMTFSPISQIQAEFCRIKGEISAVDWRTSERIENVDEQEFFKFTFSGPVDPAYKGPLSGLEMPPRSLPDPGTK